MHNKFLLFILLSILSNLSFSQYSINTGSKGISYEKPREYEIGGITMSGIRYLDHEVLVHLTGLSVGDKIMVPGEKLTKAITKLWDQGLFSDVQLYASKIEGSTIFLNFKLMERPRLSKFKFTGVKKHEADDLREQVKLVKGSQVTDNIINNTRNTIENFFIDKGYLKVDVDIKQIDDTAMVNNVMLEIDITKNEKVKIRDIYFVGNNIIPDKKLRRAMKETKRKTWYNIFKASKYIEAEYKDDKKKVITKYNELGYRDAVILKDSLAYNEDNTVSLFLKIEEGNQFFFRNISWTGNTKYTSEQLGAILGIRKGDIYDQNVLDEKIYVDQAGVFSLYQDDGYLFSNISPVEALVENDSIDIEMQVYEGKQATINNVIIKGNTKTNEHVIRREVRTRPGQLYNRSDIIRTHRELATLGYFNPENIGVNPIPNPVEGTVDIEYTLEEKPSDQIELSGGWGAGMIVGTLGLTFNNFSAKNFFKSDAWRPLPSGDGQRLSMRAQSNGVYYQAYNMSFVEPWLGGRKPTSLTVSVYHTVQSDGRDKGDPARQSIQITGLSFGLGKRLKVPDDFFTLYNELSFQVYDLSNWSSFLFANGKANNFSLTTTFSRNSVDQPIYPRRGSNFSLSLQVTPPYSLFNGKDYSQLEDQEKYRWIEYHKWTFKASWFEKLAGNLVLNAKVNFGFLGYFNKDARSPFEGYYVGGDGLSGYNLYGRETIALRGYDNGTLTPYNGGNIYNKYTLELRYPLSLKPQATLYGLVFLEGGNAWTEFRDFTPFDIKRAAGVGMRIFLPMFGMLGVDWGYGFDDIPDRPSANKSQFHFVIGQQF
ncbi:MAG: outer membrane protein assembly factor BamA [Bacteroidales bacterium]|nr:outer membrane protein assembly factor BamA [Bacteroidales bacterium]MCF8454410.1 outer membrane protein assembly factor BamA [Bacteroidales bacterium]